MTANHHDALFKTVFSDPEHARGALRAVLPRALADRVDWPTLVLCPGSFVDEDLAAHHTDLLFGVSLAGSDALVYVLFEHQSTCDRWMAYRLLRYLIRIWDRWRVEHPEHTRLPLVVPVVLYHGERPWSAARDLTALLDVPPALLPDLRAHVPAFSYLLDDLSAVDETELRERAMTALATLTELCFKYARSDADVLARLARWADVMHAVVVAPHGRDVLEVVMRYILMVHEPTDPGPLQALLDSTVGPEAKDIAMTAGQRLIEQGKREGRVEGRVEGRLEAVRDMLLLLLRQRFGVIASPIVDRLNHASAEELEAWAARVVTADSLEAVFV